jgi:hypothetical protein
MQCTKYEESDIKKTEQYIFNFLWNTKDIEDTRARDRIKRTVMKNDYKHGGLKITDVECLDKSLKLRQYIRANNTKHIIKEIQKYASCENNALVQEFKTVTTVECVCKTAQETMNIITDHTRKMNFGEPNIEEIVSCIAINQIATTNVETYLNRKGRVFLNCILIPFKNEGIVNLWELTSELETELNKKRKIKLQSILGAFPEYFINAANCYNDGSNHNNDKVTHLLKADNTWVPVGNITTKELQWILKAALNKIEHSNSSDKLGIEEEIIDHEKLRKDCKNPKLRNIYFRLIHNDFFTYNRMFKFRMTENPKCPRCEDIETTKHLLWECPESKKIWESYNEIITSVNIGNLCLNNYENLYRTEDLPILSLIKLKLIQELIQIKRPTNWNNNRTIQIIVSLRNKELYNGELNRDLNKARKRWNNFLHIENPT